MNAPRIRFGVMGGGCSGFSYSLSADVALGPLDKVFHFNGLSVVIDAVSLMYLEDVTVDYSSVLGEGFKFINPKVKSTCGCGSSFSV